MRRMHPTSMPIASIELARVTPPGFESGASACSARSAIPAERLELSPSRLDSESSVSTNSTRPAQCQWRESNSHPFGAASQTAAAAVTPHWQERKRRDSNAQDALSNVRQVSGPVQLAISATLPKAEPERVELSRPCGLPRFERGGLANVPKGSNGRLASRTLITFRSLRFQRSAIPLGEPSKRSSRMDANYRVLSAGVRESL